MANAESEKRGIGEPEKRGDEADSMTQELKRLNGLGNGDKETRRGGDTETR
jgi:hypothetical protein